MIVSVKHYVFDILDQSGNPYFKIIAGFNVNSVRTDLRSV
jgi:hypothetical protein